MCFDNEALCLSAHQFVEGIIIINEYLRYLHCWGDNCESIMIIDYFKSNGTHLMYVQWTLK